VATTTANHIGPGEPVATGYLAPRSGPVALPAILRGLPEQLSLQREDVVEDPIDPPAFEAMVGDHAGAIEMSPQQDAQRPVDTRAASNLRFLEELKAAVEGKLAESVLADSHPAVLMCPGPQLARL
jgi:hypothetical protein